MKEIDEIEKLMQQKMQNYEAPVSDALWKGIQRGLSNAGAATSTIGGIKSSLFVVKSVAALLAVVAVGTALYFALLHKNSEESVKPKKSISIPTNKAISITETVPFEHEKPNPIKQAQKQGLQKDTKKLHHQNELNQSKENNLLTHKEQSLSVETSTTEENTAINTFNSKPLTKAVPATNSTNSALEPKTELDNTRLSSTTAPSTQNQVMPVSNEDNFEQKEEVLHSFMDELPNVITPNGDGKNDVLLLHTPKLKQFVLQVFNESGTPIFRSTDPSIAWNGQDMYGQAVNAGNYLYQVSAIAEDGTDYGSKIQKITVIR